MLAGWNPRIDGPAQARLYRWSISHAFTVTSIYPLGNDTRTDPLLDAQSTTSVSLSSIGKHPGAVNLEYQSEIFNLNPVQIGPPDQVDFLLKS